MQMIGLATPMLSQSVNATSFVRRQYVLPGDERALGPDVRALGVGLAQVADRSRASCPYRAAESSAGTTESLGRTGVGAAHEFAAGHTERRVGLGNPARGG